MNNKQKILIVDDSEMNRSILADILEDKYDIIETRGNNLNGFWWRVKIRLCPRWKMRAGA